MRASTLALIMTAAVSSAAMAQQNALVPQNVLHGKPLDWSPADDARVINGVNCSLFKGKPSVCVNNDTSVMVTDLDCESPGWIGTRSKEITLPKGGIAPHTVTVVDMKSCKGTIVFTTPGGKQRRLPNVDTDRVTEIEVPKN